jgi:iron complex transport system ATP-binding protein
MIGIERVRVSYGAAVALAGVSERVADGEWLAVIGPNGAGKSTLLRCVASLARHDGQVTVGGRPVAGLPRRHLARLVAYVPQSPVLPPEMTASDYVLLGRTPHIGYLRMETAADRRICGDLLDRLQLTAMAGRPLATLSGGEAQRLVLARALAQQAPVLVLDEPTSALDLGRRVEALELIDEIRRERSLTVLSAVHDLTLAGQFADRLLLLAGGQVAAAGTARTVLRTDVLGPVFGPAVEVLADSGGAPVVISHRRGAAAAHKAPADTPPGAADITPGPADTPPGAADTPPGAADITPGPADAPPGPADAPPGPPVTPPGPGR